MPKSAALIFGLAVAAFSVGFNTARYPVVWRMAGRAAAISPALQEKATSAAKPPHANSPSLQTDEKPAAPVADIAAAPPAEISSRFRASPDRDASPSDFARPANLSASEIPANSTGTAARAAEAGALATPGPMKPADATAVIQRPLVPVVMPASPGGEPNWNSRARDTAASEEASSEVCRLPPVDSVTVSPPSSSDAGIPIYPATGLD